MFIIDYDDPSMFCNYCGEFLNDDGTCPDGCDVQEDDDDSPFDTCEDPLYDDDLYDILPGRDYVEDTFDD